MPLTNYSAFIILIVCGSLITAIWLGYPTVLWLLSRRPLAPHSQQDCPRSVSSILAVRDGKTMLASKIANLLSLRRISEIIISLDGYDPVAEAIVEQVKDPRIRVLRCANHEGKAQALNRAVAEATGDLLLFTDLDAVVSPSSIDALFEVFADPIVGGACGKRLIDDPITPFHRAQNTYLCLDQIVKSLESQIGSISSNDGKLYAIRRALATVIPDGVTDDLYMCLEVVSAGYRFLYVSSAQVSIAVPSRDIGHELTRRSRIVTRSLHSLLAHKELLNPWHHGRFACQLCCNRLLRRSVPFLLVGAFISSAYLAIDDRPMRWLCATQCFVYALGFSYPVVRRIPMGATLNCINAHLSLLCYRMLGTMCGVMSFVCGRAVVTWTPRKHD